MSAMSTPVRVTKNHPFVTFTAHTLPEITRPRERTVYGWESMKVKQGIRIPVATGDADSAYMSAMNWNKKMEAQWADEEKEEKKRILELDEVTNATGEGDVSDDDARNTIISTLMQAWYDEHGSEPPRIMVQPARDGKGRLYKAKKGEPLTPVAYDDEAGEPLQLTKERKQEIPAFKDFIRVV